MLVEFALEIGRAVNIVMVRGLTTAGDVWFPVTVGIFSQWLVAVLGGWALGDLLGLGLVGIWIAMACDEGLRGALFVVRFRRGTWREKAAGGITAGLRPGKERTIQWNGTNRRLRDCWQWSAGGVAFFWVLQNLWALVGAVGWLLGILAPFLLGGAIAFILNVPMRAIERNLMPRAKAAARFRRPWRWC